MRNGSHIEIETDDLGYVNIPLFEEAMVGMTYVKQCSVYDVDRCREILRDYTGEEDPERLEEMLLDVVKSAENWSGINPIFIETNC